jgi:surface protein
MTVSVLEFNGFDTTRDRVVPSPQPPVITNIGSDWVRPSEWPAETSISVSDQKAALLVAVYDDNNNWYRFTATCSSGNYVVDWGDGVTDTIASGGTASHTYDYATLSGSVTSYGYKTATIIVTPQTANLTQLNLNINAAGVTPIETVYRRYLEVLIGSPNLTLLVLQRSTTNQQNAFLPLIQHVKIVSMSNSYTNFSNLFYGMENLQSIELPDLSNVTSMSATFGALPFITKFPDLTATSCTTMANLFIDNFNMKSVGNLDFNTGSNCNVFGLFANCRNLEIIGNVSGRLVTTGNMFVNCHQLKSVGYVQAEYMTTMPNFINCYSLETLPYWNTVNIANMNSSFQFCTSLNSIPSWDFSNVTNMGNTFNACQSLVEIDLNLPKVTNLTTTFSNCQSLKYVTLNTTGNLLTTNELFAGDLALEKVNISNVSNVTNASFMYSFTVSLNEINDQSYANCTNTRGMFSNSAINYLPNQNFAMSANIDYMFANTRGNLSLGNFVTDASTSVFTFANSSLKNIKWTPRANVTTMAINGTCANSFYLKEFEIVSGNLTTFSNASLLFNGCTSLEKVIFPTTINLNTTASIMYRNNPYLREIPAINVNAAFTADTNMNSLAVANLQNIEANVVINVGGLTKSAIETVFGNLVAGNSTLRNININNNPGDDTVVTKSSNTTSGSNVVVIANTVGLSTGMLVTGNNISNGRSVTFQDTGDTVTLTSHGISNNNIVSFSTITSTTGISVYTPYYVVNSATDTFQVASTQGGSALPLTTDGSGTLLYGTFVDTINANANVIVSIPASGTATGQTLTFSVLDTSIATLKNWSVTR